MLIADWGSQKVNTLPSRPSEGNTNRAMGLDKVKNASLRYKVTCHSTILPNRTENFFWNYQPIFFIASKHELSGARWEYSVPVLLEMHPATDLITRLWSSSSFLTPGATGTNFWESELHRSRMSLPHALASLWRSNIDTHKEALGAWRGNKHFFRIQAFTSRTRNTYA